MRDEGGGNVAVLGVGAIAGVAAIWFLVRRSSAATSPGRAPASLDVPPPGSSELSGLYVQTRAWLPYIRSLAAAYGIPVAFVLSWIQHESGGNPCAVGNAGAVDSKGQALETGILQLMSPGDIQLAGTTVAEMRVNCSANLHSGLDIEQKPLRPLTSDEMKIHAGKSLDYIAAVTRIVDGSFARHGVSWPKTSTDYWTMVKAYHAGQGIPTAGLDASVKGLGHAPSSWAEFKQGIENLLASGQRPLGLTRERWQGAFANAEKTGRQAFGDKSASVSGNARGRYGVVSENARGQYGAARF
jgi:hypothetical protein